ncbi:MAG TPA: hypothetical protein VGC47_03600, partial [Acidimicrobiia bacterium]
MAELLRRRATTERIRYTVILAGVVAVCAGTLSVILPGSAAQAGSMYSTQMYVVKVLDGDTIRVTNGNPNDTPVDVRFAGINTNEYPEMCHAGTAKARLAKLIEGKWVTLLAEDPDSKAFDGVRYLRFVER